MGVWINGVRTTVEVLMVVVGGPRLRFGFSVSVEREGVGVDCRFRITNTEDL